MSNDTSGMVPAAPGMYWGGRPRVKELDSNPVAELYTFTGPGPYYEMGDGSNQRGLQN